MEMFYGPLFRAAAEILLRRFPRRSLFSEQQAFVFQRLLMLHADARNAEDLTEDEQARLLVAFLWIPDTMVDPDLETDEGLTDWELADERLLRFFVANGGLAGRASFRNELARAHLLYEVIANSRAARRRRDYCPLNEWLHEAHGLTFMELQAFGFSFFARSNIGDRSESQLRFTDEDYFSATGFAGRYQDAVKSIAASREWYIEAFAKSAQAERRTAYEFTPFLRRPVFIQRDGNAVVLGLRALEAWLGSTGAYYRLFDVAKARGTKDMEKFRQFNGWLQERQVRHIAHVAHPGSRRRLPGSGRVFGEVPYTIKRRGSMLTSDVAVDLGLDLVLIEVTTKRITQRSLVDGDIESIVKDVRAMIVDKARQLLRVIEDLRDDRVELPDVLMEFVQRVWPVVVVPDGLLHTPTLWAWVNRELAPALEAHRGHKPAIQPIVLLEAEEFEALMGLVASGRSFIQLLSEKTSELWRDRDFKSYLVYAGLDRASDSFPFIDQELHRQFRGMVRVLRDTPPVDVVDEGVDLAA